jgi:hypothetical protein
MPAFSAPKPKYQLKFEDTMKRISFDTCLSTSEMFNRIWNENTLSPADISKFRSEVVSTYISLEETEHNVDLATEHDLCFATLFCCWLMYCRDEFKQCPTGSLWVSHPAIAQSLWAPFWVDPSDNMNGFMTATELKMFFDKYFTEFQDNFLAPKNLNSVWEYRDMLYNAALLMRAKDQAKAEHRARREIFKLRDWNGTKQSPPGSLPTVYDPTVAELMETSMGIPIVTHVE